MLLDFLLQFARGVPLQHGELVNHFLVGDDLLAEVGLVKIDPLVLTKQFLGALKALFGQFAMESHPVHSAALLLAASSPLSRPTNGFGDIGAAFIAALGSAGSVTGIGRTAATTLRALLTLAGELLHSLQDGGVLLDHHRRELFGFVGLQFVLRKLRDFDFISMAARQQCSDLGIGPLPPLAALLPRLLPARLTRLSARLHPNPPAARSLNAAFIRPLGIPAGRGALPRTIGALRRFILSDLPPSGGRQ